MTVHLLAVGLLSLLGQVVLLRELHVAFYGSELAYVLALAPWMLWTAVGAAAARGRETPSADRVRVGLGLLALAIPLELVCIRGLRPALGAVPGSEPDFALQALAMGGVLAPAGLLLGLLFQWSARRAAAGGGSLATAYALESLGAVVGGALSTLLVRAGLRNLESALVCGLLALLAAQVGSRPRYRGASLALAALLTVGLVRAPALDHALTGWTHPHLVDTLDTPYGRVTVQSSGDQVAVLVNDALAFETEGTQAEVFTHLAALQVADPRRALVLGGGMEGLLAELAPHGFEERVYVELDRRYVQAVRPHLPPRIARSLEAEGVRTVYADPRVYADSRAEAAAWDLVLLGVPEPDSGRTNRYYTQAFFARCAALLREGGVLALRLPSAENLWAPLLTRRTASIHRALASVFDDVFVLPGGTSVLLASDRPLPRDPAVAIARLEERGIEGDLVIAPYLRYRYTNDRTAEAVRRLAAVDVPMNRDRRPACYPYTLTLWLSRFFPSLLTADPARLAPRRLLAGPPGLVIGVGGLAVLLAARRARRLRRALLAAMAGACGMVLETVLLLAYQTDRGVLYQDIGLLLTCFMAGLVVGAGWMHRHAARRGPPKRPLGAALVAVLVVLSGLVALKIHLDLAGGLLPTGALLVATGAAVSALFAQAGLADQPDPARTVGPLYAADLVGGCLGAVGASLLLVPFAGLQDTALAAGLGAVLGWLLL